MQKCVYAKIQRTAFYHAGGNRRMVHKDEEKSTCLPATLRSCVYAPMITCDTVIMPLRSLNSYESMLLYSFALSHHCIHVFTLFCAHVFTFVRCCASAHLPSFTFRACTQLVSAHDRHPLPYPAGNGRRLRGIRSDHEDAQDSRR